MEFNQWVIWIAVTLVTLLTVIYGYAKYAYRYWARKGVPFLEPKFPLGNNLTFLPKGIVLGTLNKTFYDRFRALGHKFGGIYYGTQPVLIMIDRDYIKDILVRDFSHFVNRGFYYNKEKDPLSAHLFNMDGADWKSMRIKLTPTFTSGKMKAMFHAILDCANCMVDALKTQRQIEIKDIASCFSTDVIGACAFGISCNSFKYPDAEFRQMGRRMFQTSLFRSVQIFMLATMPQLSKRLGLRLSRPDTAEFFTRVVRDAITMRQKQKIQRHDFLQLLINIENLTVDEIAAQVILFFVAGFDTSSTAISFALYEIARNTHVQDRLRDEIRTVIDGKYNGDVTYDGLMEMSYLNQIIDETLRMYPSLPTVNRRCSLPYTLRDTNIQIERGTSIWIPVMGLHHDPEYFPDPERFDPDRFSDDKKSQIPQFAYLPFGDGPRNCIGLRFGQMQTRLGILSIVRHYKIGVSKETKKIVLDPYVFLLKSKDPIFLTLEKLDVGGK